MLQNFLQNAFIIQFGLTVRDYARWLQILNGSRATKRKPTGVHAAAIWAAQTSPTSIPWARKVSPRRLACSTPLAERFTSAAQFPGASRPIPSRIST